MSKNLHKDICIYPPKHMFQNEKRIKSNSNLIEPSEQTTYGKIKPKPKNEILNDKQLNISQNKDKNKDKDKDKEKNLEKSRKNHNYYLSREIALTIEKYGREIFSCIKNNEPRFLIPINYMDKHSLSPSIRERMVDWMVEVFSIYKCDPGTFELAVHIMDCYISRTKKKLIDEDIHLIGLTCIYISSKVEDIAPLRMTHIVKSLGHCTFDEKSIIKKEREIIKTIDFDLFTAGTYDFIMTFFFDLKVNNAKKIRELDGIKIVEKYLNFSIFLSQLLLYNCEFVCFRQSLNALAVLAIAFDILKTNIKNINNDLKDFLCDWVFYVINEMGYNFNSISIIYQKIYNLYSKKVILPQKMKEKKKDNKDCEVEIINLCKFNQDKFI